MTALTVVYKIARVVSDTSNCVCRPMLHSRKLSEDNCKVAVAES